MKMSLSLSITNQFYQRVLHKFDSNNLKFAFAYGSSVFKQLENAPSSETIVDFVFIVDDSIKFHSENMINHSKHYSFLKYLGPYYVSKIQDNLSAGCYYNTLVKFDNSIIKYGVMNTQVFLKDLFDWDYLYISGRLQKPVKILKTNNDDKQLNIALKTNLKNALHTSLLLLPESFSMQELFIFITSLSYRGDFRMIVGENKNKIRNIVEPNYEHFVELYKPLIKSEASYLYLNEQTGTLQQDQSSNAIHHHLSQLPRRLLQTIINKSIKLRQYQDMEEIIFKLATRLDVKSVIDESVSYIVKSSSIKQTIKSVFTAGFLKTIQYGTRKLKKML